MNDLQIFNNPQFGGIRAFEKDGEPWFVAVDVCKALDIQNHKDALKRLDGDETSGVVLTDPHGRAQETNCVNEPGIYTLVLGSRKPEAKAFKRWVTHEVLPTLRRTGRYEIRQGVQQRPLTPDDYLRAATIIATCKNERLPYVLQLLDRAGIDTSLLPAGKRTESQERDTTTARIINIACSEYGISLRAIERATGIYANQISRIRRGESFPKPERAAIIRDALKRLVPEIDTD